MKTRSVLILLFSCMYLAFPARGEEITLRQCYEWARENYPLIRQYALIDKTEEYNLSNAGKKWLPQLGVTGKATYQSDVTKLPFDTEMLSSVLPGFSIPTLSKDQYQIVAELNQTIWDGGAIRTNRHMSRAQANVDREQVETNMYAVYERVNNLYFGILLQDELLRQNNTLQADLRVNMERIAAMIAYGTANQSDMDNLRVELLNAQQREIEILSNRESYLLMLRIVTGRELPENVQLQIPSPPLSISDFPDKRPELKQFAAQEQLAELRNEQITSNLMPQIGFFVQGGYGRPGLNFLEDRFKAYYIGGVRFSWNMGNLYTLKNDRRQVTVNRQSIDIQRDLFLYGNNLDSSQQTMEMKKNTELMIQDQEIIRLRQEIKKAAEVKLENGTISVTDMIREIYAEDTARQTAALHQIQFLLSLYNYMYTMGDL